jgi:hypothetical protein
MVIFADDFLFIAYFFGAFDRKWRSIPFFSKKYDNARSTNQIGLCFLDLQET